MYIVENYGLAVALCWVTMLCWGSWGNTQKLAAKTWRYELFYWDYVVGILLFSLIWGLLYRKYRQKTSAGLSMICFRLISLIW